MTQWNDMAETGAKTYRVNQVDDDGVVLDSMQVTAESSEAAAKGLDSVANGTHKIEVCLGDSVMNEMGVDYWIKRIRRR